MFKKGVFADSAYKRRGQWDEKCQFWQMDLARILISHPAAGNLTRASLVLDPQV